MNQPKHHMLKELQTDILRLQGFKCIGNTFLDAGLGEINQAFPNHSFPLGAVHEFLCAENENMASSIAFITALISAITQHHGTVIWISSSRKLFPPAIKCFGVSPERIVFIDLKKQRDVMWAMEEALKCNALAAVVGEMENLDFTTSRRLQLAVEQSHVTGFILQNNFKKLNTTACVSRWRITSLPSGVAHDGLPGVGFPRWKIELLRMRNGKTGVWEMQWIDGRFVISSPSAERSSLNFLWTEERQAG